MTRLIPSRLIALSVMLMLMLAQPGSMRAADPDYSAWNQILTSYYTPQGGMNYAALKAKDQAKLDGLRASLARVRVSTLTLKERQAYWMNLYNVSTVGLIVDHYPVKSIKDLGLFNGAFKLPVVRHESGTMSLDELETEFIRKGFKDSRVHFAINCAARSCPPLRGEAWSGARLDAQLDDQVRATLNGPGGVTIELHGKRVVVKATRIFKWFQADFDAWSGGPLAFIRKYLDAAKTAQLDAAVGGAELAYQDYDWALNDASK